MALPGDSGSVSTAYEDVLKALDEKARIAMEQDRQKTRLVQEQDQKKAQLMLEQDNNIRAKLEVFTRSCDDDSARLKAETTEVRAQLVAMNAPAEEAQVKAKELESTLDGLYAEQNALQAENVDLQTEHTALQAQKSNLENDLAARRKKLEDVRIQLTQQTERHVLEESALPSNSSDSELLPHAADLPDSRPAKRARTNGRVSIVDLTLVDPSPPDSPQDHAPALPAKVPPATHAGFAPYSGLQPQQQPLPYGQSPRYSYQQYTHQPYYPPQPYYHQQPYYPPQQYAPQQIHSLSQQDLYDAAADGRGRRHFPGFVPAGFVHGDLEPAPVSSPPPAPPAPVSPLSQTPHLPSRRRGRPITKRSPATGSENRQSVAIAPRPIMPTASAPTNFVPDPTIPGPADIIVHLTPYQPQHNFFWSLPEAIRTTLAQLWQLFKRKTIIPRTGPDFWATLKAMEGVENEQLLGKKCLYVLLTQVGSTSLWTKDAPREYACLGCTDGCRPCLTLDPKTKKIHLLPLHPKAKAFSDSIGPRGSGYWIRSQENFTSWYTEYRDLWEADPRKKRRAEDEE